MHVLNLDTLLVILRQYNRTNYSATLITSSYVKITVHFFITLKELNSSDLHRYNEQLSASKVHKLSGIFSNSTCTGTHQDITLNYSTYELEN